MIRLAFATVIAVVSFALIVYATIAVLDFFSIRKNVFVIQRRNIDPALLSTLHLRICHGQKDTLVLNGKMLKQSFQDLYGQEKFCFEIGGRSFYHAFNDFKIRSWEKSTYTVHIEKKKDSVIVAWELKTFWACNSGRDSFMP